ncbi:MAG: hypothetical protein AAFX78_08610 [Cyanobacteria bacterium J06638_20]
MTDRMSPNSANPQDDYLVEFHPDGSIRRVSQDEVASEISPTFIKRFEVAARLGDAGHPEQALSAYEAILAPFDDASEPREMTLEFLGKVELGKIYCLIDLQRFEEAKTLCESSQMRDVYADQLSTPSLYEYCFAYANILGTLGQVAEMNEQIVVAINIAVEHLEDLKRCERAFKLSLIHGKENQAWPYLLEQSHIAYQFGSNNRSFYLQLIAGEFAFFALRGLGQKERARRGAEKIIERYRQADVPNKVHEWEGLLASVQ